MLSFVLYLLTMVMVTGIALPGRLHGLVPVTTLTLNPESMVGPERSPWLEEASEEIKRALSFWQQVIHIYGSYKLCQARAFITRRDEEEQKAIIEALHDVNSDRLLDLCMNLRGFYIKTGQFLGTRYDFMPRVYCTKLQTLVDSVPPMPSDVCRNIIEEDFGGDIDEIFDDLDLEGVLGAASIAQVHKGTWKATGEPVAVKLQYPGVEVRMKRDLRNIRGLAEILQRLELKFDMLSAIKELQRQIKYEFDFPREAANMDFAHESLNRLKIKDIRVPKSVAATERVLVMRYIDGINLSRLAEFKSNYIPWTVKRAKGAKLFKKLARVYGAMFFEMGKMHGDPNPGNISLKGNSVGLLDWGQVKDVSPAFKKKVAKLVLAFNARDRDAICKALFDIGVKVTHPEDKATVEAIAVTMLDTRIMEGYPSDPFDERCASFANPILLMPPDIYFLVRSVQMMRGLTSAFHLNFSIAKEWGSLASKYAKLKV